MTETLKESSRNTNSSLDRIADPACLERLLSRVRKRSSLLGAGEKRGGETNQTIRFSLKGKSGDDLPTILPNPENTTLIQIWILGAWNPCLPGHQQS